MLSTKGHYRSLNRQLTQSGLLEVGVCCQLGVAWQEGVAMGWQGEGAGVDIKQGLHRLWARLAQDVEVAQPYGRPGPLGEESCAQRNYSIF